MKIVVLNLSRTVAFVVLSSLITVVFETSLISTAKR